MKKTYIMPAIRCVAFSQEKDVMAASGEETKFSTPNSSQGSQSTMDAMEDMAKGESLWEE